jgi:hypothetical protein
VGQGEDIFGQPLAEHALPACKIDDPGVVGLGRERYLDQDLADAGEESDYSKSEEVTLGEQPRRPISERP